MTVVGNMDTGALLQEGLRLHQAGQLADAAELYKKVLDADQSNVDALYLLSVVFYDGGNLELSITLAQQAIHVQPDYVPPYISLGNALQRAGHVEKAVDVFRAAVSMDPNQPELRNNLASALNDRGEHEAAKAEAEAAIAMMPDLVPAYNNLGNALVGLRDFDGAVEAYRKALAQDPAFIDATFNLGNAEGARGHLDVAIGCFQQVLEAQPTRVDAHYNLANAQLVAGDPAEAVVSYERALAFAPDSTDILNNLGSARQAAGDVAAAIETFRAALARDPENAELHWNLSLALLLNGDYDEGWREYEWRWRHPGTGLKPRDFGKPACDGDFAAGRTVLLHAEQGFGDTLHFVRYARFVADKGARVVLECSPSLTRLMAGVAGIDTVVSRGKDLGDFDCHVPLLSLPHLFSTRVETIPADVPYVFVPSAVGADPRIAAASGLKVGFAWGGSPTHADDRNRSCDPALFETLFDIPGATFFDLQVGRDGQRPDGWASRDNVVDLHDGFVDFADTAAAIAKLDLVISVDTAVAHLAGAMGKPVWLMVPFAPTFVWMRDRDDSPWYPHHKLFRQPKTGDWDTVRDAVAAALKERAG